jgi:hypothetical protein
VTPQRIGRKHDGIVELDEGALPAVVEAARKIDTTDT